MTGILCTSGYAQFSFFRLRQWTPRPAPPQALPLRESCIRHKGSYYGCGVGDGGVDGGGGGGGAVEGADFVHDALMPPGSAPTPTACLPA